MNKKIIKNRFPIPKINELLDKLNGVVYFLKIDLQLNITKSRSGSKMFTRLPSCVIRHYKFLVMPFGLTNAPTNFLSCMNNIFNKQLQMFLLMFFNDLLIYNRMWEDHLRHLYEILGNMREQPLYAKASKCELILTNIMYLGHVISA